VQVKDIIVSNIIVKFGGFKILYILMVFYWWYKESQLFSPAVHKACSSGKQQNLSQVMSIESCVRLYVQPGRPATALGLKLF